MKTPRLLRAALLTMALSAPAAFAHDDATLDKRATPHGGQLRMAGAYHFELVIAKDSAQARDNPVAVYLTDHADRKMPSAGAVGTVTLLTGRDKVEIPIAPAGDNLLQGRGVYAANAQTRAIVSITFADKYTEQARFTPLARPAAADPNAGHAGHKH